MIQRAVEDLPALYESDETAWLDAMSELVRQGRLDQLDFPHLAEYLEDMARRDRREVLNRLILLLTHLLKWQQQAERRTNSWRGTIRAQRRKLTHLLESGTLRRFADETLTRAYAEAVDQAAIETGLSAETFPAECPYTLDQLLSMDVS